MAKHFNKLAYTPSEAVKIVPVGTTTLYAMMNSGKIRYKQVGGRRVIPAAELHKAFCELDDATEGKAA